MDVDPQHRGLPDRGRIGALALGLLAAGVLLVGCARGAATSTASTLPGMTFASTAPSTAPASGTDPATTGRPTTGSAGESFGLTGRQWLLVGVRLADGSTLTPTSPSPWLRFDSPTQVSVNGGCNSGGGDVTLSATGIGFGSIAHTEMACQEQTRMQLETAYFAVLAGSAGYRMDGAALTVTGANGTELRFATTAVAGSSVQPKTSGPAVRIPESPEMSR